MTEQLAIEAAGLTKSYGGVRVLRGVDLRVPRGGCYALLGPNGAGKTTMIRILATLARADAGVAKVAGRDVARQPREVRRRISLTGQFAALDGTQTGMENLRMVARLAGLPRAAARWRASELIERFGLTEAANRRVATYSGGMRRRLDLAAGLAGNPSVIFLDEPTTGLDLPSRLTLWQVVAELGRSGATVFLTTQYLEEADQLAARVAVLNGGAIVAEGSPAELKRRAGGRRLELEMASPAAFGRVADAAGRRALAADAASLAISIATNGSAEDVRSLLDEVDPGRDAISSFRISGGTLDDVFLALTGHRSSNPADPSAAGRPAAPARDEEHTHV